MAVLVLPVTVGVTLRAGVLACGLSFPVRAMGPGRFPRVSRAEQVP
jgi:hypothetical protein